MELIGENTIEADDLVRGDPPLEEELFHPPEFQFEFVQNGGYLIPFQRGMIVTEHPVWNYILGPGRVWLEEADQGYSRASFPFTRFLKGGNSTYNGTMMFLFNDVYIEDIVSLHKVLFETLGFQNIIALAHPNNYGSLRVMEKPGTSQRGRRNTSRWKYSVSFLTAQLT